MDFWQWVATLTVISAILVVVGLVLAIIFCIGVFMFVFKVPYQLERIADALDNMDNREADKEN